MDGDQFLREITAIFGKAPQAALARFLQGAGDRRQTATIMRSIGNYVNGRSPVPGDLAALLCVLSDPASIKDRIRAARREPDEPVFRILPEQPVSPDKWGKRR